MSGRDHPPTRAGLPSGQRHRRLALTSGQDPTPTEELDSSLLSVRTAHSVREELVREAVAAGTSLSDALGKDPEP